MGVVYGLAAVCALLWQLPRVRRQGEGRLTLAWMVLWVIALGLAAVYVLPEDWAWVKELKLR